MSVNEENLVRQVKQRLMTLKLQPRKRKEQEEWIFISLTLFLISAVIPNPFGLNGSFDILLFVSNELGPDEMLQAFAEMKIEVRKGGTLV